MPEGGYKRPLYPFPCLMDGRPGDHLLHLAEEFMSVIDPGDAFEQSGPITGYDGIQVDGADTVHPSEKEEEQQPEVIFQVEELSFMEQQAEPMLPERLPLQRGGGRLLPAYQYHVITFPGQGGADPDHSLIVGQVIGDGAVDPFLHNMCERCPLLEN